MASAQQLKMLKRALRCYDARARGISAEVNVWSGDEPGSVKIGLDLPWGQKREGRPYKSG
jgi:hypothetical protein